MNEKLSVVSTYIKEDNTKGFFDYCTFILQEYKHQIENISRIIKLYFESDGKQCTKILVYLIEKLDEKSNDWVEWSKGGLIRKKFRIISIYRGKPIEIQMYYIISGLVKHELLKVTMEINAKFCCLCHRLLLDNQATVSPNSMCQNTYFEGFLEQSKINKIMNPRLKTSTMARYYLRLLVSLIVHNYENPIDRPKRIKLDEQQITVEQLFITHKVNDPRLLLIIGHFLSYKETKFYF